jgi:hypothetical protein
MSIRATHPYESGVDKNAANYVPLPDQLSVAQLFGVSGPARPYEQPYDRAWRHGPNA